MSLLSIIDSHTHVASSDRDRYPLNVRSMASSNWFLADDVGAKGLLAAMDANNIANAVIVQAVGAYGFDNSYAIDAVRAHGDRFALVASIDMDADAPADMLQALHDDIGPLIRGLRLFGVLGTDPMWLDDARADAVWRLAGRLDISLVPTIFPAALARLGKVCSRYPDVPVIVEHIGFVDLAGGMPFPAAKPLFDLAHLQQVHVKVTSHSLKAASAVGDPADLLDELVASFGANRLVWGSDFPQTQGHSYAEMVALAQHAARRMGEGDLAEFMGGTARRLWWNRQESAA